MIPENGVLVPCRMTESGEAPDWQHLYDCRERRKAGMVPIGGSLLTAGAEVQKDRIEIDVWAWGGGFKVG
jgi:phage terminase large subunit GpA-like protein